MLKKKLLYSWVNKTYKEMLKDEHQQFRESCKLLWYYYNITNKYGLRAQNSKGENIILDTDITENYILHFDWIDTPIECLSVADTIEFVELFQNVLRCLVVSNHEDFNLVNLWEAAYGQR